jgi:hypothetical protein
VWHATANSAAAFKLPACGVLLSSTAVLPAAAQHMLAVTLSGGQLPAAVQEFSLAEHCKVVVLHNPFVKLCGVEQCRARSELRITARV